MTTASSRVNGSAGRRASIVLFIVTAAVPNAAPAAQDVLYVNCNARAAGDGSSWTNAYVDLQDAVDFARDHIDEGAFEIWVAAGVYKPDRGTGDRWASFDLVNNVALYGGFAGWETLRHQRNPAANETILSGDLLDNDDPDFVAESTCCHATDEPGCDDAACEQTMCDLYPYCCDYWKQGCDTLAALHCCELCRPSRCDNSYSVATAFDTDATAILDGFTVTSGEANRAYQDGDPDGRTQEGGGLYAEASSLKIHDCTFLRNAGARATAMFCFAGSPSIFHCLFTQNFSYIWSGSALRARGGEPSVTYSNFIDNYGGGLYIYGSQPIIGCKFIGNSRGRGLTLLYGAPNIIECIFSRNWGGMYNRAFPQLFNCGFFGNAAPSAGGGIDNSGNIILLNCVFSGNSAGGWVSYPGAPPSPGWGGAVDHSWGGYALVLNCVFVGNSAGGAAGMWSGGSATIAHSIFWGNFDDEGAGEEAQLLYNDPPVVRYNNIQGWTGTLEGPGNIDVEPLFLDADGPDDVLGTEDDNFRLAMESPLINAGDPDPPLLQRYDGDGHFRTLYGRVDIGAYEFGIGDYDWDLICDLGDFTAWESCMTGPDSDTYDDDCRAFDFDADDDVDLFDLAGFQRESGTVHTIKRPSTISPYHRK